MASKSNGTTSTTTIEGLQAELTSAQAEVEALTAAKSVAQLDSDRALGSHASDVDVARVVQQQATIEFQLQRATARVAATRVALDAAAHAGLAQLYARAADAYTVEQGEFARRLATDLPRAAGAILSLLQRARFLDAGKGGLDRLRRDFAHVGRPVEPPPHAAIRQLSDIGAKVESALTALKLPPTVMAEPDYWPIDTAAVAALRKALTDLRPPPPPAPVAKPAGPVGYRPALAPTPAPPDLPEHRFVPAIGRGPAGL
jgi:hypothetical protein